MRHRVGALRDAVKNLGGGAAKILATRTPLAIDAVRSRLTATAARGTKRAAPRACDALRDRRAQRREQRARRAVRCVLAPSAKRQLYVVPPSSRFGAVRNRDFRDVPAERTA